MEKQIQLDPLQIMADFESEYRHKLEHLTDRVALLEKADHKNGHAALLDDPENVLLFMVAVYFGIEVLLPAIIKGIRQWRD